MRRPATFEVGVSPPGANFRLGFPSGATWLPDTMAAIAGRARREAGHGGRYDFLIPQEVGHLLDLLSELRRSGVDPVLDYSCRDNPSIELVHSVPTYIVGVDRQSPGFFAGELFDGQFDCGLPIPAPLIGHDAGCGIGKVQIRKLQIVEPKRVKSGDVIAPRIEPLVQAWQIVVVSSRFREVLLGSGFGGFEFLPVAGPRARPEERLLSRGMCSSDSNDYYQWVVTGRSKPLPISDYRIKRGPCGVCGSVVGQDEPYRLNQPLSPVLFECGPDVQYCDQLALPEGRIVRILDGHTFVSSRFVELCVREKFRGLSTLAGQAPSFTALYFGDAF